VEEDEEGRSAAAVLLEYADTVGGVSAVILRAHAGLLRVSEEASHAHARPGKRRRPRALACRHAAEISSEHDENRT
jgi:hypothetical protein